MSTYRIKEPVQHSVVNVKALVGAFNQEKALVGAFSVNVQLHRLIDLRHYTRHYHLARCSTLGQEEVRGGAEYRYDERAGRHWRWRDRVTEDYGR